MGSTSDQGYMALVTGAVYGIVGGCYCLLFECMAMVHPDDVPAWGICEEFIL